MGLGTKDNILELVKHIENQKLSYVLAVWSENNSQTEDDVCVYTSFESGEIPKLIAALNSSVPNQDVFTKK